MTTWQWNQWQNASYLTCSLLKPWPHGFFTRNFWPQNPETLAPILDSQATVYRIKQVHGNCVVQPKQMSSTSASSQNSDAVSRPEADALLSDSGQQTLWVCSADCNPVLVGDLKTGQVAAIHAGWRGTALKIVPLTVKKFLSQGSQMQDLVVAMGPAIAGEVYQVSTQVAVEVGRTLYDAVATANESRLIEELQKIEQPPLLPDPEPGRVRLDVRRVNVLQLKALGLALGQIAVAPHCTFQEPEQFFSYRRTREKKVQWSGIVSR
jgi:hypothetical protein